MNCKAMNVKMFAIGWRISVNGCPKPSLVGIAVAVEKTQVSILN
jgi:hypothetical protein